MTATARAIASSARRRRGDGRVGGVHRVHRARDARRIDVIDVIMHAINHRGGLGRRRRAVRHTTMGATMRATVRATPTMGIARSVSSASRARRGAGGTTRRKARAAVGPSGTTTTRATTTRDARARRRVVTRGKSDASGLPDGVDELMRKYAGDAAKTVGRAAANAARTTTSATTRIARGARTSYDGVFALLFLNFALFACDHWAHMSFVKTLYLNHARPTWWQFATSTFCHANWAHLSSNIFFLYIFGKLIEEEEGAFGVWMSYLVTGIGANLASWFLLPKSVGGVLGIGGAATVSLGASGAVFGLFAVSVLVKLSWNWRRILEVVILGQFVVDRFLSEAKMIAAAGSGVGAGNVNHVAHLGGAIAGVLLIIFLQRMVPK